MADAEPSMSAQVTERFKKATFAEKLAYAAKFKNMPTTPVTESQQTKQDQADQAGIENARKMIAAERQPSPAENLMSGLYQLGKQRSRSPQATGV